MNKFKHLNHTIKTLTSLTLNSIDLDRSIADFSAIHQPIRCCRPCPCSVAVCLLDLGLPGLAGF